MARRTIENWIKEHPEDWEPAENAGNYNSDFYDFLWNSDYTLFHPSPLAYEPGDAAYIAYQGGDPGGEDREEWPEDVQEAFRWLEDQGGLVEMARAEED